MTGLVFESESAQPFVVDFHAARTCNSRGHRGWTRAFASTHSREIRHYHGAFCGGKRGAPENPRQPQTTPDLAAETLELNKGGSEVKGTASAEGKRSRISRSRHQP
jgi:hypothetical protein